MRRAAPREEVAPCTMPFLLAGAVGAASSRHRRRCQRNHTGWFETICVVFRKRTAILREALVRARERGSVRLPRGNWSEQDGRRLSNCSCSSASAKSYFCFHNQEHETPLAFRNGTANNCELSLRVGRIQCSQMRGENPHLDRFSVLFKQWRPSSKEAKVR
jgi:hypothetical protein